MLINPFLKSTYVSKALIASSVGPISIAVNITCIWNITCKWNEFLLFVVDAYVRFSFPGNIFYLVESSCWPASFYYVLLIVKMCNASECLETTTVFWRFRFDFFLCFSLTDSYILRNHFAQSRTESILN